MRADLHMHTFYSDGAHSAKEVVAMGKAAGLRAMAVTDHDTMGACGAFFEEAKKAGILPLKGLEISAYEGEGRVHVLGYGCAENEAYVAYFEEKFKKSEARIKKMICLANEMYGLDITYEEFCESRKNLRGPYHAAQLAKLVSTRLHRYIWDVFAEAFAFGMPAHVPDWGLTPEGAVSLIHACGGRAVLAHPGRIGLLTSAEYREMRTTGNNARREFLQRENLLRRQALVDRLAPLLDGIEAIYAKHTPEQREFYRTYALEHGLAFTGGSDFHSEEDPPVGCMPFDLSEELYDFLSER